jgi:hypothetical protein
MDNLADAREADAACADDGLEDRRHLEGLHRRAYTLDREAVDVDARSVIISLSSDAPVERSFGTEILEHSAAAIDLEFLGSGRAPLLLDHDTRQQIGVIEEVTIDSEARKTRAKVRFGKGELADEVFRDVVDGEGATSSDLYFTGSCLVSSKAISSSMDGMVEASYSVQGNGALTESTVS